jgi:hypothetical protein
MRLSKLICALVAVGLVGCKDSGSQTYVVVKIQPGAVAPTGIHSIDLQLSLNGMNAMTTLSESSGGDIMLPTDATLQIGDSATGDLMLTAIAKDSAGIEITRGMADAQIIPKGTATLVVTLSGQNNMPMPDLLQPDLLALPATLVIDQNMHDFSIVATGSTSAANTFKITNNGPGPSGPLATAIGGTGANEFALVADMCSGQTLGVGASCAVGVTFSPTADGAAMAALTVNATPGNMLQATLTGTGAPVGALTITPTTNDFGPLVVNMVSPDTTFTIQNTGATATGQITVAISGADSLHFTLDVDNCSGMVLNGGASCTVQVSFTPSTTGSKMATLSASSTPGGTALSQLTGAAYPAGMLSITPTSKDFLSVVQGSNSAETSFVVKNNDTLTPTGPIAVSLGGTDRTQFVLTADGCSGLSLSPGGTCAVKVRFHPTSTGAKAGTLAASASPGGVAMAALTGTGATPPQLTVTPTTNDFGPILLGQMSSDQTFMVQNTGSATSGTVTTALGGTDAALFAITAGSDTCNGMTLASMAMCQVKVHFAPGATATPGAKMATLTLSASPGGMAVSMLAGQAVAPAQLTVAPTTEDFGAVVLGAASTDVTFTVTNAGGVASGVPAVTLTGPDMGEFVIGTNNCTAAIAGAGMCTVLVHFAPSTGGTKNAALNVTAAPGGTVNVPLTGNGLKPGTLSMTPPTNDFGAVLLGQSSSDFTFTVMNAGMAATGVPTVALSGTGMGDFAIGTNTCTAALNPGVSCTINVHFTPTASGATMASLSVTASPGGAASSTVSGTGQAPANLDLKPTSQAFADTVQGQSSPNVQFTVTNLGDVPTGVPTLTLGGGDASDFSINSSTCTAALAGHATCTFNVRFSPTSAAGAKMATVTAGAAPGGTAISTLTGTALTPPQLAVAPMSQSYGSIVLNTNSIDATFTVSNGGGGTTPALAVALMGANANQFVIASDACTGNTLAGGGSCVVTVHFKPTTVGTKMASLQITAGLLTTSSALDGTGIANAQLTLTPTTQDFGSVVQGANSTDVQFTLTNTGMAASGVPSLMVMGGDASMFVINSNSCTAALNPGENCFFDVHFSPSATGPRTTQLIATTVPGGTVTSTLTGTGLSPAQLAVNPMMQAFASQVLGNSSADIPFVISNSGQQTTGVPVIALNGADASQFAIGSSNCTAALAPGGNCTVNVHFAPSTAGAKMATLDASATPGGMVSSNLSGTGLTPPALSMSPPMQPFGSIVLGTSSADFSFTVTNTGGGTSPALTAAVSGPDAAMFVVSSDMCTGMALAGGASCVVKIHFSPTSNGPRTASLGVTGGSLSVSSALSGTGLNGAAITIAPVSPSFGSVVQGQPSSSVQFTVTNTGEAATGTLSLLLGGTDMAMFAMSGSTCTGTLAAGASCTVNVTFTPTSTGTKSATLTAAASPGGNAVASLSGTGITAGNLTISPSTQNFPSTQQGLSTSDVTFTVTNTGGATSGAIAVTIGGTDASQFVKGTDGCNGVALTTGSMCSILVHFSPTTTGAKSASLSATASPGGTATAGLTGTGLAPALLTIAPTTQAFPSTVQGQASPNVTFTVTNTGGVPSGQPMVALGGTDASQFGLGMNTCTAGLAPNGTCTFAVLFMPSSAGAKSASVSATGAPGGVATATLSGTGLTPPALTITPTPISFGSIVVGSSSADTTFTVTNTGGGTSPAITMGLTGTDASQFALGVDGCTGQTLAGGGTCTVKAHFSPTTTGNKAATLNAAAGVLMAGAAISGTSLAQAQLTLAPSSQNFPSTVQNTSSNDIGFTVTNTGGVVSGIPSVSLSGTDASQFAISSNGCTAGLQPGNACTIQVHFAPTSAGAKMASLNATAVPGGTVSSTLTGTGLTPANITIAPTSQGYANTVVGGSSVDVTFTVTNTGGGQAGIPTIALTGTDASQFTIDSNNCNAVIPASGTCTFNVKFTPTAAGAKNATVSATSSPGGVTSATLTGTALAQALLAIAPTSQAFPSTVQGQSSSDIAFTVTNNGGVSSGIPTVALGGTDPTQFVISSNGCTAALAPAGTCTINVHFAPTTAGAKSANVSANASPGGTATATLTGTGLTPPNVTIAPTAQSFGSVTISSSGPDITFTVSNSGGGASGVLNIVLAGTDASQWVISADACSGAALNGGANCIVKAHFSPTTAGAKSASLQVNSGASTLTSAALTGTGLTPALLSVSPMSQAFPATTTGQSSSDIAFTVTNTGQSTSGVVAIALGGTDVSQFALGTNSCTTTLAANGTCTFNVHFSPSTSGSKSATATASASPGGAALSTLSGVGLTPAVIALTPPVQSFASTVSGQSSPSIPFTVTNNGQSTSGTITFGLSGTNPTQFTVGTTTCTTLAAGGSCTVNLTFTPTTAGGKSATLSANASPGGATSSSLSGTGLTPPSIAMAPTTQPFGSIVINSSTPDTTFTVTNSGGGSTASLTTSLVGTDPTQFAISMDTCNGMVLAGGANCQIQAHFSPTTTGAKSATLQVAGGGLTASSGLTGTGLQPATLTIAPTSQNFASTVINQTSTAVTFTVTNTGGVASGVVGLNVTGTDSTSFVMGTSTCNTLAAGANCTFNMTFQPTTTGSKSATVTASASPGNSASSTLTGTALSPPALTMNPTSQGFGSIVTSNSSADFTFTVTNTGGGTSPTFGAAALSGANANQFVISSDLCNGNALAGGGTCQIKAHFSPTVTGPLSATLTATAGTLTATSSFTGTGLAPSNLTVAPTSQAFPSTVINQTSADVQFTVTNNGGVTSGTVSVALGGTDVSQFVLGTNNCTATLAPNGTCTFNVHFAPTTSGAKSATATAMASPGGSAVANLSGTGLTPPAIAISPSPFTYAGTVLNQTTSQVFTVTNTGGGTTTAFSASSISQTAPNEYTIPTGGDGCSGNSLPGGGTCTITVNFTPTVAGNKTATLTATAGTLTAQDSLSGNGLNPATLTIMPPSNAYPSTVINQQSADVQFTVTNSGGVASGTVSLAQAGTDPTQFQINSNLCTASLPAGGSCTFNVRFTPNTAGAKSANVTASASPGGNAVATMTGTGLTPPALAISPSPYTFPGTVIGTGSATNTFTVTNTGGGTSPALAAATLTMAMPANAGFSITQDLCMGNTLAGGGTCQITVKWAPVVAGANGSTLGVSAGTLSASDTLNGTGLTPATFAITQNTAFVTTTIGNTTSANFTLQNTGTQASGVPMFAFSGTNSTEFALGSAGNTCTASLPGNASCTFVVNFSPNSPAGAKSATLTASGSPGAAGTANLSATAVTPAALTVAPNPQNYAGQLIGTSSPDVTFTVTNTGGAATTTGVTVGLGGTDLTQFVINAASNGCNNVVLAGGASCTVGVHFSPTSSGLKNAQLNATANPLMSSAMLSGTGQKPAALSVTPTPFTFANTVLGNSSASQTFTVTNTGDVPTPTLSVSEAGTNPGDFPVQTNTANPCNAALNAGATCTFSVTFTPVASGSRSATVTVTGSGGSPTVTANVSGLGQKPATLSASGPLSWPVTTVGTTSASNLTETITNTGDVATSVITTGCTGANCNDFMPITDGCNNMTLGPGASCQLVIQFKPAAYGPRSGVGSASAATGGTANVNLSGTGQDTVILTFAPTGSGAGTATSSDSQLNCTWNGNSTSGACTANYIRNTSTAPSLTITATQAASSNLGAWSGLCAGQGGNTCGLTLNQVNSNPTISVSAGIGYTIKTFTLTVNVKGAWGGATGNVISGPGPHYNQAMAYDVARNKTLMYGGVNGQNTVVGELWEYDNATQVWSLISQASAPGARQGASLVYDSVNHLFVLFGGASSGAAIGDTWQFDPVAQSWAKTVAAGTPGAPTARYLHSMAFDSQRGVSVMFGGLDTGTPSTQYNDTYEYSYNPGTGVGTWTQRNAQGAAGNPAVRYLAGMVYDSTRNKMVLAGGNNTATSVWYNDTYEWNSSSFAWTSTGNGPWAARSGFGFAFDSTRGKAVLFGGWSGPVATATYYADAYEYNGTWSAAISQLAPTPGARSRFQMAYEPVRGKTILQGGTIGPSGVINGETWEYTFNTVGNNASWTNTTSLPIGVGGCTLANTPCVSTFNYTANNLELSANPTAPFVLQQWTGDCSTTAQSCGLPGTSNHTVTAIFKPNYNYMFVSSNTMPVPFAPTASAALTSADGFCFNAAHAAGLGGNTWHAWLSSATGGAGGAQVNAISRQIVSYGWVRPDGLPFMNYPSAGSPLNVLYPPRITEFVNDVGSSPVGNVGTGTVGSGVLNGTGTTNTCGDWTATTGNGTSGVPANGNNDWTAGSSISCASPMHLYCFQGDVATPIAMPAVDQTKYRLAFLTNITMNPAQATGVTAFDNECQSEGNALMAGHTWKALISTSTTPAANRFSYAAGTLPWQRPDGVVIATTAASLMNSVLIAPPDVTANMTYTNGPSVLSGSATPLVTGGLTTMTCNDWTSNASANAVGYPEYTSSTWWEVGTGGCGINRQIYCLQQ